MIHLACEPALESALARRFLFITGKGGVGKTLVSAALAARSAASGARTLWVEMAETPGGAALFPGFRPQYDLVPVRDHLWAMNLRLQPAIEEYLAVAFKLPFITRLIARNRLFQVLTAALPGLDALIPLGKIWYELGRTRGSQPYWDRIVLDAPATGHALTMLQLPQAALNLVQRGNVAERAREIDQILGNCELTSLIAVTRPEQLAVDETVDLIGQMQAHTPYRLAAVVCNGVHAGLPEPEAERLERWLNGAEDRALETEANCDPAWLRERLQWLDARQRAQGAWIASLAAAGPPLRHLPWIAATDEAEILARMIEALSPAC